MPQAQRIRMILITLLLLVLAMPRLHAQSDVLGNGVAVVRGQGALLLDDTGRQPQAELKAGMLVTLLGRSADGGLLYVESNTYGTGWVAASSLLTTNVADLPVRPLVSVNSMIGANTEGVTQTLVIAGANAASVARILVATPQPTANLLPTGIMGRVTLTDNRLNLRAGPGTTYPIVGKAEPASTWQITGRSALDDWVQIESSDSSGAAWAAAAYLSVIIGNLNDAPVITDLPPAPTPTATPLLAPTVAAAAATTAGAGRVGATGLAGVLVFQERIGGAIYVYDLGDDTLRPLTTGIDPAISNDGRMVAFARDGGEGGLYVINLDGSGERLLYNERSIIRSPKWSPDDQWIVFSRSDGYSDCRLLSGGGCLPDDAIWNSLPSELQTGKTEKAIHGLPNQREYFFSLARIGVNGDAYRDIPALTKAQAPDWNEAGITYYSSSAGIQITADTEDARSVEVANDPLRGYFQDPDWQPGGGRIVFHRQMGGQHWQIFIVNPDGTGLAALTQPVTALVDELPSNVAPAWSPDGQHIVYLSNRTSIESTGAWHLWVMNADGSEQRMLPVDVPLDYTFSAEQMVSWGP
ncbi:MAG: SH3 domain-containing protein [Caldilineaceae bacterium]